MLLRSAALALVVWTGSRAGQTPSEGAPPSTGNDTTPPAVVRVSVTPRDTISAVTGATPPPAATADPVVRDTTARGTLARGAAVRDTTAAAVGRRRRGAEFVVPLGSVFLPGLGQYVHGARRDGLAYSAAALAGYGLSDVGDADGKTWGDLPLRGRDQLAEQALGVAVAAGFVSAWDAFHRAVPALQRRGRYEFLTRRERPRDLLTAPFDPRFLRRWTTWVDLAQTGVVTALILSDRRPGGRYRALRAQDAAYATALAANAAAGEEAAFRGWLLPLAYEHTGRRFWLANGVQAGVFGAAHLPDAGWGAAYIGAWAAWEGWIVRRNQWSVRESVFHHFWYNAAVVSATFLTTGRDTPARRIAFPTLAF
jgi:membrane protease YdiL (CAAX protease family)